jgi:TPR repeat protein
MRLLLTLLIGICCSTLAFAEDRDVNKGLYKSSVGPTHNPYKYTPSKSPEVEAAEHWLRNMCGSFDTIDAQNKFLPLPGHKELYVLHQRALNKDHRAQAEIADRYIDGRYVPKDWETGICWYRAAAQNGSSYAEYWLGIFYQNGWVVKESATVAAHWFTLASRHGDHVAAERQVAERYAYDDSGVHDMGKALVWYERAAAKHDLKAELALGNFYTTSHESGDIHRALSWYGKASAQHSVEADYNIGQIYYRGVGIKQDYAQAHKWLLKAAERGYHPAQYDLAEMYYRGRGVHKDWIKSYAWLELSHAADNNPAAIELEDMLVTHFTPEQLTLASNLTSEYRARYAR